MKTPPLLNTLIGPQQNRYNKFSLTFPVTRWMALEKWSPDPCNEKCPALSQVCVLVVW